MGKLELAFEDEMGSNRSGYMCISRVVQYGVVVKPKNTHRCFGVHIIIFPHVNEVCELLA
jgi:hypothetical protein